MNKKIDYAIIAENGERKTIAFFRGQDAGAFHSPMNLSGEEAYELALALERAFPEEFARRKADAVPPGSTSAAFNGHVIRVDC